MALAITHSTSPDGTFSAAGAAAWVAPHVLTGIADVAQGGTGLASLDAGRIPFGNGTSPMGNTDRLYFDNTNNYLRIGRAVDQISAISSDKLQVGGYSNLFGFRVGFNSIDLLTTLSVMTITSQPQGMSLIVPAGVPTSGYGGHINIFAGGCTTPGSGGLVAIQGGYGNGFGSGGHITLAAGNPGTNGYGGNVYLAGGAAGAVTGDPGDIYIAGGTSSNVSGGGDVTIYGGPASDLGHTAGMTTLLGGYGNDDADGGDAWIIGGDCDTNNGGDVYIVPGSGGTHGATYFKDGSYTTLARVEEGYFCFGTYTTKAAETFQGYVTIKDVSGVLRKVMICA